MINFTNGSYQSSGVRPSIVAKLLPSFTFYIHFVGIILRSAWKAKLGIYDDNAWGESSEAVLSRLESVGLKIKVEGLHNIKKANGPVVFVGNHMSMMETLLLPSLILPYGRVTYVIKESLLNYPIFKYVMRSRNPIAVTRTNPRQDLKAVLTEGCERLRRNISIIVFPQTTRALNFDPQQMSTIGAKLAQKASVCIVPLAVKTDAWENGHVFKDFGKINVHKKTYFSFGDPIKIEGKGTKEQSIVNAFIAKKLEEWGHNEISEKDVKIGLTSEDENGK